MSDTPATHNAESVVEPFHTFDHYGNEYVIVHGNVAIDVPTDVVLWPLPLWKIELERRAAQRDGLDGAGTLEP